jgi:PurA ssDNA and RNA-binding protein
LAALLITFACGIVPVGVVELLMISDGHSSSFGRQPYQHVHSGYSHYPPRSPVQESMLKSAAIQVERKTIILKLKQNHRGRFLRISEENNTKINSVIIPSTGLTEFKRLVEEMEKASSEMPATNQNGAA